MERDIIEKAFKDYYKRYGEYVGESEFNDFILREWYDVIEIMVAQLTEELNRHKQALTKSVSLPKGQLPHGQGYYTWMNGGNCVVEKEKINKENI